ncbi:MAG: TonB-dependent receptor domain-containing protein [Bacteroidota bacterium]|jgi:outer membrane receptor protein involved in Fe transport
MKLFTPLFYCLFSLGLVLCCFSQSQAQGRIKGIVHELATAQPLPFATVSVYSPQDSLVGGGITDEKGRYEIELPLGTYYALVEFMGFESITSDPFTLTRDKATLELPLLSLQAQASDLEEVLVQGEKTLMELSLDKRIFNVGKDLANAGGNASDILMNLPSVAVDPEGNVRLRGSANVRILIDGKPSGLVSFKGSSGLRQLPANLVERVEVITNPSARYEAEGMAGVINIILKKDNKQGFNGSGEVVTGSPLNLGITANVNYRKNRINWFINYGIAHRKGPGRGNLSQEVYNENGTTSLLQQSVRSTVTSLNNSLRGGLDYFFSEQSILTASYVWRRSDAHRITDIRYQDYLNTYENYLGYALRRQDETEDEPNKEAIINFKKKFAQQGHELNASFTYLNYWERSDQLFTENAFDPMGQTRPKGSLIQTSLNDEYENQFLLQVDYTQPFATKGKIETGIRTSFREMENDYLVQQKMPSGNFETLEGLDNVFLYDENILAAYGILGNESGAWSYQAGLRAEYSDIETRLVETKESNPRTYTNLFPSGHLNYKANEKNAFQVSYSRRVRRPVYNDLSPYVTFSDQRNFFSGNPNLNPEFTDAFEMGYIRYGEKSTLFSTLYYRNTLDKIQRIRSVQPNGFSITAPYNLDREVSYGLEFSGDYAATRWWKLDFNANFFYADVDGSNLDQNFQASTTSVLFRQSSRFTLPKSWDLQLRANYEAKRRTAQGIQKGIFFLDLSASKKILQQRGTLILTVADVLNSRINRYLTEGANFLTEGESQMILRQTNLTFSYRINP